MKKSAFFLLIIIALINAQDKTYTLEEALSTGLSNSKQLTISKAEVISSEARLSEMNSQMLPKLSFNASYTRLSDVQPFQVTVPFSPTPIKIQDAILNNYQLKLSLQQPLFTGFRLSSLKNAAEYNSKAAELEHSKEINEEAFKIHTAFWNYYKAQKALRLVEENLKSQKNHLDDTKNFMENGLATKNDFLKLQVQYSNTKLMRIETQNMRDLARAAFNKALGINLSAKTQIDAEQPEYISITTGFDELLNEAFQTREELKSLDYKIKAGNEAVTAAEADWFPSIYLFGDYYYNRPNQRLMPLEDRFYDTWDVGVALNWELWNWGNTSAKTTQAEQQVVKAETSLKLLKEGIELEVYKDYLGVISEFEKVSVSRKALEQSEENYRITKDKYNQQLATSSDLIDAETALLNSQTNFSNALVDLKLAKTKLYKSVGRKIY